jgi:hypothetical protein
LKPRSPAKAALKTVRPSVKKRTAAPWSRSVGQPCSFYYEGGHGDRYWSGGWHYGIIREIPIKGKYKNWIRVELPTDLYGKDDKGQYYIRQHEKAWVFSANINEPGDVTYHGPKLDELVAQRKDEKAKDIAAAKRRKRC